LLYFYGEGTLQYIACLLSAYFLVLCGYFDFVNNQILSLGFWKERKKKSESKGPWDHPVISKSQRIFTSFMKELAKKEARVTGQFFHYYFIFLFP
jgi:hypothetical protein